MSNRLTVIILAAGKGSRMKSGLHKTLHPIAGKPMLYHLLESVTELQPDRICVVVGSEKQQVIDAVSGFEGGAQKAAYHFVEQTEQLGTGHAVKVAVDALAEQSGGTSETGDVLVLYGDVPFVPADVMRDMIHTRQNASAAASVLGFTPADAGKYGRLVLDEYSDLLRIVEFKDASDSERQLTLCNSGMMALDAESLPQMLGQVRNDNAAGEYYLTDLVAIAREAGKQVTTAHASEEQVMGVNSRADLASAEAAFQARKRREMMDAGVTLVDPDSVFFAADTVIAADVTIEPHVFMGAGVTIGAGSVIRAFSHLEGAIIGEKAQIGPYARLRPGTELAAQTKVGNFVETKKAKVGVGSKINHLSYVGDAVLGADVNVGAGTITCNYDGFNKAQTTMGDGSFIGSNSALVAPVNIGAGAIVAAGSTITKDVEPDSLAITRAGQKTYSGWAVKFRKRAKAAKDKTRNKKG